MTKTQRGVTGTYECLCCKDEFTARKADRARGWARYCSKRCKAIKQEQRSGQFAALEEHDQRSWSESPTFSNAHQFDNTEL